MDGERGRWPGLKEREVRHVFTRNETNQRDNNNNRIIKVIIFTYYNESDLILIFRIYAKLCDYKLSL